MVTRVDLGGKTLGEALLTPTRIYVRPILELLQAGVPVKAMAHITGGGITENLDRVLPKDCDAEIVRGAWPVPRVIETVVDSAALSVDDAYRTFNMGIGFMLVLDPRVAPAAAAQLRASHEQVYEIGEIVEGTGRVSYR